MKTKFNKDIVLGKHNGKRIKLLKPSWDCDWYWGFGYLQTRDLHTHFDNEILKSYNMETNYKEFIEDTKLSETQIWTLCQYMGTFYKLKEFASVINRGGTYISKPCIEPDKEYAKKINKVILPKLFDDIYDLLTEGEKNNENKLD